MSESECDVIQSGINYLLQHANAFCRDKGTAAQARYDAPPGVMGFASGNQQSDATSPMYVLMTENSNDASGYGAINGYTNVEPAFWSGGYTDPQHTGSLIAHEEEHQAGYDGPGHNTGLGQRAYDTCMNPQS